MVDRTLSPGTDRNNSSKDAADEAFAKWLRDSPLHMRGDFAAFHAGFAMGRRTPETRAEQPMLTVRSRGPVGPNDVIVDATELVKHVTFRMSLKVPATALKASCGECAAGMNSFTDPDTGKKMHARNGTVTLCSAQKAIEGQS